jgi:hypothetical protein
MNEQIKKNNIGAAEYRERQRYLINGINPKNELNKLKREQQIASQANKIKQDKKERDERLNNNETQSNSIETLKPFQSEQKCSTDNLKDCEIEKLLDIINDPKTPQDIKDAAMKKILDIINDPKTSQDIKNAAMKKIM